jgi:hypothetical protein
MAEQKQPITRDGVLLKVGDRVFTHTRQENRDSEVVFIDGGSVVVREDGHLQAISASLCWGRNDAMLQVEREHIERRLREMRATIDAIPACEAELAELNNAIAALSQAQQGAP